MILRFSHRVKLSRKALLAEQKSDSDDDNDDDDDDFDGEEE